MSETPTTYRTRQEIFDLAYIGLAGQNFERSVNGYGDCQYRGDGAKKCAIGFCISDENYSPLLEAESLKSKTVRSAARIHYEDRMFAVALQLAHDCSDNDMQSYLHNFAFAWNVTVPTVSPEATPA